AIKQGFENLKEGNTFDGLYYAAQGRTRSDWLVGINASQALSIAIGNGMYSLGRMQTPTLALICKRFLDNRSFEVSNYWQIELLFNKDFIEFKGSTQIKWNEQNAAINSLKSIQRNGKATITSIENGNLTEQAPLLFDLTGLQKEANKKLNLTAEDTLNIAQSLYEKKFITYPRTGSKHIPEDMWDEIPKLLRALQEHEKYKLEVSKLKWGRFNKRIVNDLRVTDHHGLLITDKIPSALSAKENAIYNLIVFRLLEALSSSCIKEITVVNLEVLHYEFTIKVVKIVDVGWRAIKGSLSEDDNELLQHLPNLKVGDELKIKKALMLEKQTKPPMLYTEASLLSEMENAGNTIENDEAKKILKNIGIGTPATRASIIETLFKRNYIERQKKALLPTQKGLFVYHKVKNMKIVDVALTAEWEIQFEKIETRKLNPNTFQKEIEVLTKSITEELLQTTTIQNSQPKLTCPKCKTNHLLIRDQIVKCSDELCNWVQFRNICGIQLTINNIEALISKGKTGLLKGMKSKSGKIFSAFIILNENCKTSFEFV
ncbi:type IA DNA topoisomerase, partial [Paenimyroides tangerinum]